MDRHTQIIKNQFQAQSLKYNYIKMFFFFRMHIYYFDKGKQVNNSTGFSKVKNLNLKNPETFWNSPVRFFSSLCYNSCAWFLYLVWTIRDLFWEVLHFDNFRASYNHLIINTKLHKSDKISLFIFLCKKQGFWSLLGVR